MRLVLIVVTSALLFSLSAGTANAREEGQESEASLQEPVGEVETTSSEGGLVQENTLEGCRDGLDNDDDGHLDCDDQDCEIYAMCLAPPAAEPEHVKALPTFVNMRQLKLAVRTGRISRGEFHRAWMALRHARSVELDNLRASYRAGQLSKHDYRHRRAAIIRKYEG